MTTETPAALAFQTFAAALTLGARGHDDEYAAEAQFAFATFVYERDKERLGGDPPRRVRTVQLRPHFACSPATPIAELRNITGSVFELTAKDVAQGDESPTDLSFQGISKALWEALLAPRWAEITWTFPGSLGEVVDWVRRELAASAVPTLFTLDAVDRAWAPGPVPAATRMTSR